MQLEVKKVVVIRYLRHKGENSNLGGATLKFHLNYEERTIKLICSVCSIKENFSKEKGLDACAANYGKYGFREYNLDKFRILADRLGGFTNAYVNILETLSVSDQLTPPEKALLNQVYYL